ncbi:MAG: hypothetical protein Q4D79_10215 [Propionibacteriaceae bacterium]|nr:hypothetical protein [Propionibacteriaceae bacterium]
MNHRLWLGIAFLLTAAWLAWALSLGASSPWVWVPLVTSGVGLLLAWRASAGGVALATAAVLFVLAVLASATIGWFLLPAVAAEALAGCLALRRGATTTAR